MNLCRFYADVLRLGSNVTQRNGARGNWMLVLSRTTRNAADAHGGSACGFETRSPPSAARDSAHFFGGSKCPPGSVRVFRSGSEASISFIFPPFASSADTRVSFPNNVANKRAGDVGSANLSRPARLFTVGGLKGTRAFSFRRFFAHDPLV